MTPQSAAGKSTPRVRLAAVLRQLDLLALGVLMLSVCNAGLARPGYPTPRPVLNYLDESWQIDLLYKAAHGLWSGRDFAFTYGPLWQWLAALVCGGRSASLGSVFKYLYLFPCWFTFGCVFVTGRLLLAAEPAWKRAVYLLILTLFWVPMEPRDALVLVAFCADLRIVLRLPDRWFPLLVRAWLAALLAMGCWLMSGDAGVGALAALCVVFAVAAALERRRAVWVNLARFGAAVGVSLAVGVVAVNLFFTGHPMEFRFWSWQAAIIGEYRWIVASPMAPADRWRLLLTCAGAATILAAALFRGDRDSGSVVMRPVFLWSAALLAALSLQKGIVRADWMHVDECLMPATALAGAALIGFRTTDARLARLPAVAAWALTLVLFGFGVMRVFSPALSYVFWSPAATCPPDMFRFDDACLARADFERLSRTAAVVDALLPPSGRLTVFPYENLFGLAARRTVSGAVLQNYLVGSNSLAALQLDSLERERPAAAVYSSGSWAIDGVSNFTRVPQVWFYLQRHYRRESEPAPGVVVLRRDEERSRRWSERSQVLWRGPLESSSGSLSVDPGPAARQPHDFLKLRLKVAYPWWWKLCKPSGLYVSLEYAGGAVQTAPVLAEPGRPYAVWLYPGNEPDLRAFFGAEPELWRPTARAAAIVKLRVFARGFDWISVAPRSVTALELDGVDVDLRR